MSTKLASLARGLLRRHWWLGLTVAVWAWLIFASGTERGFDVHGLRQLESADAAEAWLARIAEGASVSDAAVASEHLVQDPYYGPMNGLWPALVGRVEGGHSDMADLTRLVNTLFICLAAWCLFSIGRRAGGLLAGLGAAVALIAVPRIWAAATAPGFTAAAVGSMTLAAMCMAHARDRFVYLVPAVVTLAMALLTTQLAWLLLLPWVYLTFFDARRSGESGWLLARPLTLWAPLVFPLALAVAVFAFPPLADGGLAALGDYLQAFVQRPREPTLYLGTIYQADRLPWHASIVLTVLTTPPTVLFLAVFGLTAASPLTRWLRQRKKPNARSTVADDSAEATATEALRLSWSMLLLALALPLLMGTTHSHGVDLLALPLPWLAVFAGVGLMAVLRVIAVRLQRLFAGRRSARLATLAGLTTLGWGIFVFAFKDTQAVYPQVESYYNWLVSGVDGATEIGLPRNPHGALPPDFLSQLVEPGAEATIALVPWTPDDSLIFDRYRHHGLISPGLWGARLEDADLIVFRYDETTSDFYHLLPELYAMIARAEEGDVRWFRREGLPLFVALRLPR